MVVPHFGKAKKKAKIPKALREQVWKTYNGSRFSCKCYVQWCTTQINTFNFEVGHNIPESKGGGLNIRNLRPICAQCNRSMGNKYTIDEWNHLSGQETVTVCCCFGWF